MIKRLQSLEIQGLKTFATLTRLEFPGKITAIVGPNGSGKSNIADGVRWVLGEQSYSLLRAKRTEDMIFSGSQQRSRSGMGMASITFNNEDGWLPIDFSEVTIARRAYRDGQNEYLLNGQRVRLKDISELLSQTGLSERTYTIIGQGLVDVALALKPDERRKLFEEAAGIGLYRSRKEEALRRLESTRKNLDRILDIMTEIRPRLRSLERQAERFEQYERLKADLKSLLVNWYGYQWHKKQQDLRVARNAFDDQERRLDNLRIKFSGTEDKVEESRLALQNNRKELEVAHSELSEYHQQLQQTSRELAILEERKRSLTHQKGHLEIDIENLKEEIIHLDSQQKGFEDAIQQKLDNFHDAEEEVKQFEDQLADVSASRKRVEDELLAKRQARLERETEKIQTNARLDELNHRVGNLRADEEKIISAIAEINGQISEVNGDINLLQETYDQKVAKFFEISKGLVKEEKTVEKYQITARDFDEKISEIDTKQVKLDAQLDVLIQAEAALTGYSEGSKTLVENSRKGHLPKGIEPLSKYLTVNQRFERAISAALGELADLVIVPSQGAEIVIEYLEAKDNDRVALIIPSDWRSNMPDRKIIPNDEIFGYANDLIEVKPIYKDLVDRLLSDIVIVKNRVSAKKIQPQLNENQKIVTLNGIVYQANGVIISGQSAAGRRIGRTRRKSEIQKEIEQLSEEKKRIEAEKHVHNNALEQLKQEINGISAKRSEIEAEKDQADQELQEAEEKLTRLQQHKGWLSEQAEEIQKNLSAAIEEIKSAENQMGESDAAIASLLQEENMLSAKLETLPLFELQQTLNRLETNRIVTQNALEASRQRFGDHRQQSNNAQERLSIYQGRLSDIEDNLKDLEVREASMMEIENTLSEQIKQIESEKINPLTATGQKLQSSLSALEKLEEHNHHQVIAAERQFTQTQLELSRKEDQLNNLRDRIEDDFGLVAFDYDKKINGPAPLPFGEGLIQDLPRVQDVPVTIEEDIKGLKGQIRRMGAINPEAQHEYYEVKERYEFLTEQIEDLEKASIDLSQVIEKLDSLMEHEFLKTFKSVNKEFSEYFYRLFNGGEAKLLVSDEENPVEGGIDIEARLPGRRSQGLALLSGGERSLTAVALIFALLKVSPTPFCILDEVDAMLDESNVGRFIELLTELSKKTQFVIITHNRNTVQAADVIYGVTMGRDSTSQMISLKLEDVDEKYLE